LIIKLTEVLADCQAAFWTGLCGSSGNDRDSRRQATVNTTHKHGKGKDGTGIDLLVRRVADLIARDKLTPGDYLPPVRRLARQWRATPNVVRDGILRAQMLGLVEVRPRSGVVVRPLDYARLAEMFAQTLPVVIQRSDPSFAHLIHARIAVETETVRVAARRQLPEDVAALQKLLREMNAVASSVRGFIATDEQFHLQIARIAGNPVLLVLLDLLLHVAHAAREDTMLPAGAIREALAQHRAIYAAIAAGDPERAVKRMTAHLRHALEPFLGMKTKEK
jgi:GntR family transcriptional repressor for pyruvate dehydrogenase complex